MLIVMVSIALVYFVFADFVPACKSRSWKLVWVYAVMMVFMYFLVILTAMDIKLPSPAVPLKKIIEAILGRKLI